MNCVDLLWLQKHSARKAAVNCEELVWMYEHQARGDVCSYEDWARNYTEPCLVTVGVRILSKREHWTMLYQCYCKNTKQERMLWIMLGQCNYRNIGQERVL